MKKAFLAVLFLTILIPTTYAQAALLPLVQCGNVAGDECTICDFFAMLANIYNFLVFNIATPLAVLAVTIGAVMLLISAGNPGRAGAGKTIIYSAIIGLVLVFCSWLIINVILTTLGFNMGTWFAPNLNC